jgi:hypothetical protein
MYYNNADRQIIAAAPERFTRQDLLKRLVRAGYGAKRADGVLEYGVAAGLIERTGRGEYRKTTPTEANYE